MNVGRSLHNRDILVNQLYANGTGNWWNFNYTGERIVHISNSSWNNGNGNGNGGGGGGSNNGNRQGFRTSGIACIEERPTVGNGHNPIVIEDYVTDADIDDMAANGNDAALQFGRYDPAVQKGQVQNGCPSEATKLQTYIDEASFNTAVSAATANVTGGTYHDVGMLWGARFLSRTGFFSGENPVEIGGVPVNEHIVFMTDGKLDTGGRLYSAFGVDQYQNRINSWDSRNDKHISRFESVCDLVKSRGTTVWVIAFDVTDTDEIEDCATSDGHFYTTDGSDLEVVFDEIGRGIGNLRLTR